MLLDIIKGAKKWFLEEKKEDALCRFVLYGKIAGKATRGRRSTLMANNCVRLRCLL